MTKRAIEWFRRIFRRRISKDNKLVNSRLIGIDFGIEDRTSYVMGCYTADGKIYIDSTYNLCPNCGNGLFDYTEICEHLCRKCRRRWDYYGNSDYYEVYKIETLYRNTIKNPKEAKIIFGAYLV